MAAILKFLWMSLAILCFFDGALGECTLSDIKISQSGTAGWIHGKPEYEVVISNTCTCSQSSLLVSCNGFQSTKSVDPGIFQIQGDKCSINNGQPVSQDSPIKFKYAWDEEFGFEPISSQINCS